METNKPSSKLIALNPGGYLKCPYCDNSLRLSIMENHIEAWLFDGICQEGHRIAILVENKEFITLTWMRRNCYEPVNYKEYILSPEWKARATAAKVKAGWRCQLCNEEGDERTLHAHHRTYKNIGHEDPTDITVLCSDCHAKFHDEISQ
jgi:hypothetical protein